MTVEEFIAKLNATPDNIDFKETIAVIETHYDFTPTEFQNGELKNEAGQNSGSCKLFSFAQRLELNQQQTLNCFGDYYRIDVLQHPTATDHQNIRNFMKYGWQGIHFKHPALSPKE
ncbi:HopJ type III effector protein [Cellvibrio mixtus]|uniref:HopJ type III effector protein n=1 Tax=Cellvibrio mixtus TaxID=39650 RepID=UPI0005864DDD|nr:HopJ type III effector protein [Cellvibrio mixtus]